jgi:putative phosphoesterase
LTREVVILRIGVISDTHLKRYDERLKRIIDTYFRDVDLVLHAGDIIDLGVLELFSGRELKAVCGNMDSPSVRSVLPEKLEFSLGGFKFGMVHGWGSPFGLRQKVRREFGEVDCIVYGHTHQAFNESIRDVLFFNPGSAAHNLFSSKKTIGILEINNAISGHIIEIQDI